MIKLQNLLSEDVKNQLNEDAKYDDSEIVDQLKKLVKVIPKGVEWDVPYNARTDNKKVNDGRKALQLVQGAVDELQDKGDDTGYFVVSDVRFDRNEFDRSGGASQAERKLEQIAKKNHYYSIYKIVDFFRYEPELADKLDKILIRLWTDVARSTGRKLGRGDLGKLD